MQVLYSIGIRVFYFSVLIYGIFNLKARAWLDGRKNIFERLQSSISGDEKIIWFHAASLGEFEQGRPVIEFIKKNHSTYKILLTFFSPSGYEVRKNYAFADYIYYLPLDTKKNAEKFIEIVNPAFVFFIKYEFWNYYLKTLKKRNISLYLISAIFRPGQVFFKWYGGWYRKLLDCFTHLYVQDSKSLSLLNRIGVNNVTIAGDTRFDRVAEVAANSKEISVIQKFKGDQLVVIAGSTWPPDEELIVKFINSIALPVKFIIAPHQIKDSELDWLESKINKPVIRYSQANENNVCSIQVLVIDNVGMLSSLYKYGDVAYIGGGFGVGIHNILEAATFGLPVVFGPNYKKFREALSLVKLGGAFVINEYESFRERMTFLLAYQEERNNTGKTASDFVSENRGATNRILENINF
jgi:3-deoxy-D-manno-octulosonic-acid transferase